MDVGCEAIDFIGLDMTYRKQPRAATPPQDTLLNLMYNNFLPQFSPKSQQASSPAFLLLSSRLASRTRASMSDLSADWI